MKAKQNKTTKTTKSIKKRNPKTNNSNKALMVKSIHEVTRTLRNITTKQANEHPYLLCRFNPFGTQHKSEGLPDADNNRRLVVDHMAYTDISLTSGGMTIRVAPTAPYGAFINPTVGAVISLTDPVKGSASGTEGSALGINSAWIPVCTAPEFAASATDAYTTVANPYSATKARLIGVSWRLVYTGQASNCNGIITVRDNPVSFDRAYTAVANSVVRTNNLNTAASNIGSTLNVVTADWSYPSSSIVNAVECRPETNPWGVLKHVDPVYKWTEWNEQPSVLLGSSLTAATITAGVAGSLPALLANNLAQNISGINLLDEGWTCTDINVSSVSAPVSFRLEVKHCFEYQIAQTSPMYPLTKAPPKDQPKIIEKAENISKGTPPALTSNQTIL